MYILSHALWKTATRVQIDRSSYYISVYDLWVLISILILCFVCGTNNKSNNNDWQSANTIERDYVQLKSNEFWMLCLGRKKNKCERFNSMFWMLNCSINLMTTLLWSYISRLKWFTLGKIHYFLSITIVGKKQLCV